MGVGSTEAEVAVLGKAVSSGSGTRHPLQEANRTPIPRPSPAPWPAAGLREEQVPGFCPGYHLPEPAPVLSPLPAPHGPL